jgi:hypothetical protein
VIVRGDGRDLIVIPGPDFGELTDTASGVVYRNDEVALELALTGVTSIVLFLLTRGTIPLGGV